MSSDSGEHELTDDDKRILKYVAANAREQMPSRRDALKLGATGFAAAGLGSGITGAAMADGHNDNDGQVGTESNPVDVISDHIQANSASTEKQSLTTRHIRVWSDSGDMLTTVDPSVSTPVQDALDAALAGGAGWVELPPGTVQDTGPVYMHNDVDIVARQSNVEITGAGTDGLVFDSSNTPSTSGDVIETNIHGTLKLIGQGATANTGTAIRETSGWFNSVVDHIEIDGWNGPAWVRETGSNGYQRDIGFVKITNTDAGNADGLLDWEAGGAPDYIHYLAAYAVDDNTGVDSTVIGANDAGGMFGAINCGGTIGEVLDSRTTGNHGFQIRHVNYEPTNQNSVPGQLFFAVGQGPVRIDSVALSGMPTVDYVFSQFNGANNYFGSVRRPGATINNNIVENNNDTVSPGNIICECKSTEIDEKSGGTLTEPITALGDLTMVS